MGDISKESMLDYVTQLYNHKDANDMMCDIEMSKFNNPYTFDDSEANVKKMADGKAFFIMHINAKMLKWTKDSENMVVLSPRTCCHTWFSS